MTPSAPTRSRTPLIVVIVLLVVAGAGGLWYMFLRPSGPAPVVQASSTPGTSTAPVAPGASATPPAGTATAGTATAGTATAGTGGGLAGPWKVDPSIGKLSDFSGSFVGYRVQEELANVGGNTAVGRTADVTGSLTLAGTSITAAEFSARLTGLTSDNGGRDGRVRDALNISQFPTATFVLGSPIVLTGLPADGQEIRATATGKLTIRGVTRDVQLPMTARLSGSTLTVKGALEIKLADFGIPKPSSFLVLSIADTGTIEVQLQMTRG